MPTVLELGGLVLEAAQARHLIALPLPLRQGDLSKFTQKKVQTKAVEDCKKVLKLCDAEGCIDQTFNDPKALARMAGDFAANLWTSLKGGTVTSSLFSDLSKSVVECMKKKVLSQKSVRHREELTYWKRLRRTSRKS
jgi:hypothetical protein